MLVLAVCLNPLDPVLRTIQDDSLILHENIIRIKNHNDAHNTEHQQHENMDILIIHDNISCDWISCDSESQKLYSTTTVEVHTVSPDARRHHLLLMVPISVLRPLGAAWKYTEPGGAASFVSRTA